MDQSRLIALIKPNKALYDMSHKKYGDVPFKNFIWCKIGQQLNANARACKRAWAGLREMYRKILKRRKAELAGAELSAVLKRKWKYEDQMSFVEPHTKEREPKSHKRGRKPKSHKAAKESKSHKTAKESKSHTTGRNPKTRTTGNIEYHTIETELDRPTNIASDDDDDDDLLEELFSYSDSNSITNNVLHSSRPNALQTESDSIPKSHKRGRKPKSDMVAPKESKSHKTAKESKSHTPGRKPITRTTGNIEYHTIVTEHDGPTNIAIDEDDDDVLIEEIVPYSDSASTSRNPLRSSLPIALQTESDSRALIHYLQNQTEKHEESEIDIFFRGLAKTVKKFSLRNQHQAKAMVFNVISDLEYKDLCENITPSFRQAPPQRTRETYYIDNNNSISRDEIVITDSKSGLPSSQ